jgi:hypothetical protein
MQVEQVRLAPRRGPGHPNYGHQDCARYCMRRQWPGLAEGPPQYYLGYIIFRQVNYSQHRGHWYHASGYLHVLYKDREGHSAQFFNFLSMKYVSIDQERNDEHISLKIGNTCSGVPFAWSAGGSNYNNFGSCNLFASRSTLHTRI